MSDPAQLLLPLILDGLENGWEEEHEEARTLCEAAPDLLEACKAWLSDNYADDVAGFRDRARKMARAAIAKAEETN